MLKNIIDFFTSAIAIYMLIIVIRIAMSWFSAQHHNDGVLAKLCDPYLNIFKKIPFLKIGYLDFSPIAALAVLVIAGNILGEIGKAGRITFGVALAICIKAIWSATASLLFFLFIIIFIRLLILLVKPNAYSPILKSLDSFITPLSAKVSSIFTKNTNYAANLILLCITIIIAYFVINFAVNFVVAITSNLQF